MLRNDENLWGENIGRRVKVRLEFKGVKAFMYIVGVLTVVTVQ